MTYSAGPRSPCAGGRPDWNGTQGVGVPGFAGVLRCAGIDETVKKDLSSPENVK